MVGNYIMNATFFGIIILLSLVAIVESIPFLKWALSRVSKGFDLVLFVATVMATIYLGLNMTAGLTVAGFGYTMVYAPYLRENMHKTKTTTNKEEARRASQVNRK